MSFSGIGRSANARTEQETGAMTASRWSATHPAHREEQAYGTRFDESSAGYPSTSCSPAELASVSPTDGILLNRSQAVQQKIAVRPTVSKLVSHARGQAQFGTAGQNPAGKLADALARMLATPILPRTTRSPFAI
jgi:hypothetical protein